VKRYYSLPSGGHSIPLNSIIRALIDGQSYGVLFDTLFPKKKIYTVSSGSAALALSLKTLQSASSKVEVIMPAYTCPSILAAILDAGLNPVICDLSYPTFSYDLNALERKINSNTLAVIAVHLFGIPVPISKIRKITEKNNCFLIEDSAQLLDNRSVIKTSWANNTNLSNMKRPVQTGSLSDLSVFSFGRGKPFSLLAGGAVCVNNTDLIPFIEMTYQSIPQVNKAVASGKYLAKLLAYAILFHPRFYWIPEKMPFLHIGETIFTTDVDYGRMLSLTERLGAHMLPFLESIGDRRRYLTELYADRLHHHRYRFDYFPDLANCTRLLRFPLLFKECEDRDRNLALLAKRGLGVSGSYPAPINMIEGVSSYLNSQMIYPNALLLSQRILTLPLHDFVKPSDVEACAEIISSTAQNIKYKAS